MTFWLALRSESSTWSKPTLNLRWSHSPWCLNMMVFHTFVPSKQTEVRSVHEKCFKALKFLTTCSTRRQQGLWPARTRIQPFEVVPLKAYSVNLLNFYSCSPDWKASLPFKRVRRWNSSSLQREFHSTNSNDVSWRLLFSGSIIATSYLLYTLFSGPRHQICLPISIATRPWFQILSWIVFRAFQSLRISTRRSTLWTLLAIVQSLVLNTEMCLKPASALKKVCRGPLLTKQSRVQLCQDGSEMFCLVKPGLYASYVHSFI